MTQTIGQGKKTFACGNRVPHVLEHLYAYFHGFITFHVDNSASSDHIPRFSFTLARIIAIVATWAI
ncbi:hypothetical protein F7D08_0228 [Bifidobacterium cebidarum]|uniref:Uncharacterized protein n=1 Tax=Bifidobacterium cebidarum TaxID=2650773 RepID=A0A6I1GHX7_9BIFI|nr:hypothetical protein F7D08_0228 [Bifidobacterium cebidarum]